MASRRFCSIKLALGGKLVVINLPVADRKQASPLADDSGETGSSFGIWPADTRETTPPALLRYGLTLRLSRVPSAILVEPPQSGPPVDLRCVCAHLVQIAHCMAISGTGERITSRLCQSRSISRLSNLAVKFTRRHTSDVPPPFIRTMPRPMMTICMNLMTG